MTELVITTLAERPELAARWYEIADSWPRFMLQDPVGDALWHRLPEAFPEYSVIATSGDTIVARGRSVPFAFPTEERPELPDSGWDRAMIWAMEDHADGVRPTAASALEIAIDKSQLGQGLSSVMVGALRVAVRRQGHDALYAPVRPNGKTDPSQPMTEYVEQRREDGLPTDPWLRVHVRAGGTIVKVAPASMIIAGSLDEWRGWTGLPFDEDGDVVVPGGLTPVRCHLADNVATYVEANVWVRHDLT
ncbi:hypothetical protein [Luteipulveratus mongoliensis]|uniref:Acetyltransferase-like protein n=1 Tax=Luteipulveratus mongoliensis TaxID=571913 RepID=A0A0K1JGY3_9MICO|nr:hypothetical protein [Luteipulveratus mongoliensis]AKU15974.1 acetyltransferase-like protein [Luteipulveratus mongoliensis]